MPKITITAVPSAPAFAQGLVRDLRVRWALEEAGLTYEVDAPADRDAPDYRRWQPFGQVPAFDVDGLQVFESGAIVHLVAEDSEALMPRDRAGRARTLAWMFAALDTIEPPVRTLFQIDNRFAGEPWAILRRPGAVEAVKGRLAALATWLEGREHLLDRFTAADILMVTVLRFLRGTDLVAGVPVLDAYVTRCEARPAFRKALADQLADYDRHAAVAA